MVFSLDGIDPDPVRKKSGGGLSPAVESSAAMRAKLKESGRPVIVAFSRGKDSIATMISLIHDGVPVIPVHLWRVPGLKFEDESLAKFEEFFGMEILNLPHRDFWYYLENAVHTAPWMSAIFDAGDIRTIPFPLFWATVRDALGLDDDTWVCDGVRAADSPMRRLAMVSHGPWTAKTEKVDGQAYLTRTAHVVWDWKIKDIRRCMSINNVELPIDYDLFGRTFDGTDYRFIKPLSEKLPDDFKTIRDWFPGVDLEMMRYECF